MLKMEEYVDDFGCIVQGPPHRDGGDGGHRMGGYRLAMFVREKLGISNKGWWEPDGEYFKEYARLFLQHPEKGWLRRHPDDEKWYSGWHRASRDLMLCLLSGYVVTDGMEKDMKRFIKSHFWQTGKVERIEKFKLPFPIPYWLPMLVSRFYYKNHVELDQEYPPEEQWKLLTKFPDPTLFETWGLEIRGSRAWWLKWLLPIFDLETLVGAWTWNNYRDDDTDVNSHLYVLETAQHVYPTFVSRYAHKITNWRRIKEKYKGYYFKHPPDIRDMYYAWEPVFDHYIKKYNQ